MVIVCSSSCCCSLPRYWRQTRYLCGENYFIVIIYPPPTPWPPNLILSLPSRFVPCHWLSSANLCCSWQQRSPSMSPGATAECRGSDNRVVKTGPAAQPDRSPEPPSVCSCPQATPWGPGHEEPLVHRPHITVWEWAETWKHLCHDHKCDGGRWRAIQMLCPQVEGWREGSFCPPFCWWVQGCSLCRVADCGKSPNPKIAIHILHIYFIYIFKVVTCVCVYVFFSEPTAVKTTVAWIYPTEFPTTGLVEEEVKGEKLG